MDNFRRERIERLLKELRYEVQRGMMDREVDEQMTFTFIVPISNTLPGGVVHCRFETRPIHRGYVEPEDIASGGRLRIVASNGVATDG